MRRLNLLLACSLSLSSFACGSSSNSGGSSSGAADSGLGPYPPPAPDDCITDVTPGHQTLTCEGLSFELNVPDVCLQKWCGLIVDVHGLGMNGELENNHTKLRELGGAAGYIVVQPSAPAPAGGGLPSWSATNDPQVFAIMQRVINVWHVHPKRIHFGGYSMGGWMTWRFVCAHSDVIASFAPIAAGFQQGGCEFTDAQHPVREVPIFQTHGRNDGLVAFSTATQERDALIAYWKMTQDTVLGGAPDQDYLWTRYKNANGTIYEFAEHSWETNFVLGTLKLLGHCFPGSDQFLGCAQTAPNAFTWGEEVLKFYQAHPMP